MIIGHGVKMFVNGVEITNICQLGKPFKPTPAEQLRAMLPVPPKPREVLLIGGPLHGRRFIPSEDGFERGIAIVDHWINEDEVDTLLYEKKGRDNAAFEYSGRAFPRWKHLWRLRMLDQAQHRISLPVLPKKHRPQFIIVDEIP